MVVVGVVVLKEEAEEEEGGDDSLSHCAALFLSALVRRWIRWPCAPVCVCVCMCIIV